MVNTNRLKITSHKIVSIQFIFFIMLGACLGCAIIYVADLPYHFMSVFLLAMLFPFTALIIGDIRRYLLVLTIFSLPLLIDLNFMHKMENQAGAHTMGIALRDIFVILLLLWWIIEITTRHAPPVRFYAPVTFPAIIYLEVCLLTLLWAPRMDLATMELVQMFKVLLLYLLLMNHIRSRQDLRLVMWALVAIVAFEAMLASVQIFMGKSLALDFLGEIQVRERDASQMARAGGTLGHPNRLAMFLELLLPMVFGVFFMEKRKLYRGTALCVFGLGSAAMIMTGSRGGWIALIFSLCIIFYFLIVNKRIGFGTLFRTVFFLLIGFTLVITFFSESIEQRLFGDDHGSAISRIPMFQIAFSVIEAHPLGGVGVNNYAVVMQEHDNTILGRRFGTMRRPVHNIYLLITGETGFIGLMSFLWLVFAIMRTNYMGIKSRDDLLAVISTCLFAGFAGFLLHGLVDKHIPGGNQFYYLLMAMSVVTYLIGREGSDNVSNVNGS